jgi:hypothetical protein
VEGHDVDVVEQVSAEKRDRVIWLMLVGL